MQTPAAMRHTLLDNRGKYGLWEVFSPETRAAILPTSPKPWFPRLDMRYGIGLKYASQHLGQGAYGHGGGCGTQLAIHPEHHFVFAMLRARTSNATERKRPR